MRLQSQPQRRRLCLPLTDGRIAKATGPIQSNLASNVTWAVWTGLTKTSTQADGTKAAVSFTPIPPTEGG